MVMETASAMRAAAFLHVQEELVTEHADRGDDRARDRRPEGADRRLLRRPREPGRDVVADVEEQVEVVVATGTRLDAPQHLLEPAAPLAAGSALPARLVCEEPGDAPRRPHHARGLVHGDDRPGAEHRARLADLVLVEGEVELVGAEPVRRRAAGDKRLEL